jgi:hypothetical protein
MDSSDISSLLKLIQVAYLRCRARQDLSGHIPQPGMRALIANSRGPKSRAEMAAEQFRRAVGLEKKWFFSV